MATNCKHILTILAVKNLQAAETFYDRAFGWKKSVSVPVYVEYELSQDRRIGLYARESFALNTGVVPAETGTGAITATELYLHCDDLNEAIKCMDAAGARLLAPRQLKDWGDEAAYFADPDGNVIVLASPAQ